MGGLPAAAWHRTAARCQATNVQYQPARSFTWQRPVYCCFDRNAPVCHAWLYSNIGHRVIRFRRVTFFAGECQSRVLYCRAPATLAAVNTALKTRSTSDYVSRMTSRAASFPVAGFVAPRGRRSSRSRLAGRTFIHKKRTRRGIMIVRLLSCDRRRRRRRQLIH